MRQKQKEIPKEPMKDRLYGSSSALDKYQDFFVGQKGWVGILQYEFYASFLSLCPGAAGLLLRRKIVPRLLGSCGTNSLWGRDIQLRHPNKIQVGDRVAIDDHCLLDARAGRGIVLGDDVVIARDCILLAKLGEIVFGDRCTVSNQCHFSSASGIRVGHDVGFGGQSYIGGGLYHTDRTDIPMLQQGLYSRGPVIIGDDVWIGAGVRILDGATVGKGSFIGAGAIISESVPAYSKILPYQKTVALPRTGDQSPDPIPKQQKKAPSELQDQIIRDKVLQCIQAAVVALNQQLDPAIRLDTEEERVLFDSSADGGLDSLGLINFLILCEQKVEEEFGRSVNLSTVAQSTNNGYHPFSTLGSFADYLTKDLQR